MRTPLSPTRRHRHDIIRHLLLLCFVALVSLTVHTLPDLQRVLDGACCGEDVRIAGVSWRKPSCWRPKPVSIGNSSHFDWEPGQVLRQPSSSTCGHLRRNWTRLDLTSPLAKEIEGHQTNCSQPTATFHVDNLYGMGSHFYVWSQALCNAMESGHRLRTHNPEWLWMDQGYCDPAIAQQSPLLCYLPQAEFRCGDEMIADEVNVTDPRNDRLRCSAMQQPGYLAGFRAASMEYLFQSVSPLVIHEAQRQVGLLFGSTVPEDLIVVHMRWGDKFWEMDLAHETEYVTAVTQLLTERGKDANGTAAHVYLATEDPNALAAFEAAAPPAWKIYVDRTIAELDLYRPSKGNRASWTTRHTKGRAGLVALGSLLVALEADDFVLTTKSNWSRLINELRKNVIDPRCANCTRMIDLRPGEW